MDDYNKIRYHMENYKYPYIRVHKIEYPFVFINYNSYSRVVNLDNNLYLQKFNPLCGPYMF